MPRLACRPASRRRGEHPWHYQKSDSECVLDRMLNMRRMSSPPQPIRHSNSGPERSRRAHRPPRTRTGHNRRAGQENRLDLVHRESIRGRPQPEFGLPGAGVGGGWNRRIFFRDKCTWGQAKPYPRRSQKKQPRPRSRMIKCEYPMRQRQRPHKFRRYLTTYK